MAANDWQRHWEFGEAGIISLRSDMAPHAPHGPLHISTYGTKVYTSLDRPLTNRDDARYYATRLLEAVAYAELAEIADVNPRS